MNNLIQFLIPIAQATGEASAGGIGQIINNITTNLQGQISLALSGVAIACVAAAALWGMVGGSEEGPKTKKRLMTIGIFYIIGITATQIVGWLTSMVGGSGGFGG